MIIYLHGFNSGGASVKAALLRQMLAPIPVLAPTYPAHQAQEAVDLLQKFIKDAQQDYPEYKDRLLLIGSSLGGLYARYLARETGAGLVLINPAMLPEKHLLFCVGHNRNEVTGEDYELTAEQVLALGSLQVRPCDAAAPTLVLLDEGDELLDYRLAEASFRGCGKTIVYPGGSHRFDHLPEAEAEIRRVYEASRLRSRISAPANG